MAEIRTIAVIGLGLIGGSILKRLKNQNYNLIGVSRRQETINQALAEGLINEGSTNTDIACTADIIFVCTPINKIIETLDYLGKNAKSEAIITDAASIKGEINDFANSGKFIRFIGGHPMAGTENKGLDSSLENLFEDAKWVLTPSKWASEDNLKTLTAVIEKLGAKVIIADAHRHDKAAALISHMPLFLSQALFSLTESYPVKDISDLAMSLAASGFRDMTRLASTNPELAQDMLLQNKENVIKSIEELQIQLDKFKKSLADDENNFVNSIEQIAQQRKNMYSLDGKNLL